VGQKVNPIGLRLALNKNWSSLRFARKENFGNWLHEDAVIRNHIVKNYGNAAIAKVLIERYVNRVRATIYSGHPGVLLGKKGADLEKLREEVSKLLSKGQELLVDVVEVAKPETCAQLVAEDVARQLERRIGFRRAMKKAIQSAMELGAEGIKIQCSGRLGAAELARTEQYKEGRTPLHTLKAHIDYGFTEANTTAGKIGVKVWICHKEPTEVMQNAVNAKKSKAQKGAAR
jgi:small subunit ribosomal protein S3